MVEIETFGCKLNHYDSLLMQKSLKQVTKKIKLLNSCAVTAQAGKDIRKRAEKIRANDSESLIVVVGCGAQVETELYEKNSAVDLVVGNSDRKNLKAIIENFLSSQSNQAPFIPSKTPAIIKTQSKPVALNQPLQKNHSPFNQKQPLQKNHNSFNRNLQKSFRSNIFKQEEIYSDFILPHPDRTRAFLKIQDGCDSFCTFCIIPFARGKSKSLSIDFLIDSVHKLEEAGIQEAVLTGVHIGDYKAGENNLEDLIESLLKKTTLARFRLTSLEPIEITDRLLDYYKDERMCPHFHISLQSANSQVLKSMKRKYSQKEVEIAFQKITLTQPRAFVGMDLITGFPTESLQDFKNTYDFLKNNSWSSIHVFPYSARKGTYSDFKYKSLEQKEVKRRSALLRELSQNRFQKKRKEQLGTLKKTLLFKKDNTKGLSRDYWKVKVPASSFQGEKQVRITGFDPDAKSLVGLWI